jgi:secreted Zn-dependent insulinase-like peptidase
VNVYRLIIVSFVFACCQFAVALDGDVNKVEIKKGSLDKGIYHYEVLDNQLRVLLISDPEADKAAAALDVSVGSYNDPHDREGLAHFLEHMLFLGTQKYPEADEYQSFISDNGGGHNAYTSRHHTNYFFDIDVNQLEPALDRFAQFFIAPLFDEFYVDRERNAVHSEYQAKIKDDYRRGYDVYRHVVNPKHPDAQFNVGSLQTLADRDGDKVRDDLLEFYRQYYSADKMTLVVLGKESIDQLRKLVTPRFSQIPLNKDAKNTQYSSEPLFNKGQLPFEVVSRPIQELRQMSISFELPSIQRFYKEKPLGFIGHILGHEGKGSLLSLLKKEGLAEGLSAGGRDKGDNTSAFYITIRLTEKGVEQRELIRSLVFYVIEQIKSSGIEKWRYDEERLLSETAFHFREKTNVTNTVSALAKNLHEYPPQDIISGTYLLENYDSDLIRYFLEYMKPENMYVSTVFPEAKTDKMTRYYDVPYAVSSLSESLLALDKKLTAQFSLPQQNPFIPENISLYTVDESLSELSRLRFEKEEIDKVNDIWIKQEVGFGAPKAKVSFRIISPHVSGDLRGVAINELYADIIRDRLNEYNYPALLAGATLSLRANSRGLDVTLTGYHDKLHKLMELFITELDEGIVDSNRFEQLKTDLLRSYRNMDKRTPYHQLYQHVAVNLYDLYWSNSAKRNALEGVFFSDLKRFVSRWRQGARVQGLLYGNLDQNWLSQWKPYIKRLSLPGEQGIAQASINKLQSELAQYDVQVMDHNDTAAALYVQGLGDTLEDRASMTLLRQMMHSPFYTSLRTEQQLGYIVFVGSLRLRQVPGSVFIVQSPSASTNEIQKAIDEFLTDFESRIPDDISVYQQSVITQLMEEPTSLSASADDHWSNLIQGNYQFDNRQRLAEAVKALDADTVKNYFKQAFLGSSKSLWQFSREPEKVDGLLPFVRSDQDYQYP